MLILDLEGVSEPYSSVSSVFPSSLRAKIISSAAIVFLMIPSCMGMKGKNNIHGEEPRKLLALESGKEGSKADLGAEGKDYMPGEVLVEFKEGVSEENIMAISKRFSLFFLEKVKGTSIYRFRLPGDKAVPEAVDILKQQNEVKTAQPNYIYRFNKPGDRIR